MHVEPLAAFATSAAERAPLSIPGAGILRCRRVGARTVVHSARAKSPLRLLLPGNHGHAQWAFVATLGGGLVDGDAIDLAVDVEPGAAVLLGTQASTKAYRAARGTRQTTTVRVGEGALFVALPDPVTCFAGSKHAQSTEVALARGASLVLVDTMTSGRAARDERWHFQSYASRTRVTREGASLVHDAIALDGAHGPLEARMGRFDVLSTIVATGPAVTAVRASLLAAHAAPAGDAAHDLVVSASPLGDDGVLLRVAAREIEPALRAIRGWLAPLSEALGDDPFARKW